VIPGFAPKPYPGDAGDPPLPVNAPELAKYHFAQLPAAKVTAAALSKYDTVIVYGIRWSDIPRTGQSAINAFAAKHKVLIWDADATPAQTYSNFVHPFTTLSSGRNYKGKPNDSVVSYPQGPDFLASDNPSSQYFLDPNQLVQDRDEINDMNAMKTGTANWLPGLIAANQTIPQGGWALAWSYGVIGDHTGMTVYSGLDADSFPSTLWKVNNDRKELALELAAPFRSTPDSCAPNCTLPPPVPNHPYAGCSLVKHPRHWVHGRVPLVLKTSVAAGITAQIVTHSGQVLASGSELNGKPRIRLVVPTKKLRSNRVSRLQALVFVNGQQACHKGFRLKVDNVRPRLLRVSTTRRGVDLLRLRVSERALATVVARNVHRRRVRIAARHTVYLQFPASMRTARLIVRDRAGNTVIRRLVWH